MKRALSAVLASTAIVVACGGDKTPVGPEPATQLLTFSVQPTNANLNQAISPAIQVEVRDASGALVTTATDAVTLSIGTNPGTGTLSGTQTVNAVGGVATFSSLSIDKAGIGYTLAAASGLLTGATSAAFDVVGFGKSAYVTNTGTNDVSVINLASNTVTATVAVGSDPRGVAITPDGAFSYCRERWLQQRIGDRPCVEYCHRHSYRWKCPQGRSDHAGRCLRLRCEQQLGQRVGDRPCVEYRHRHSYGWK